MSVDWIGQDHEGLRLGSRGGGLVLYNFSPSPLILSARMVLLDLRKVTRVFNHANDKLMGLQRCVRVEA